MLRKVVFLTPASFAHPDVRDLTPEESDGATSIGDLTGFWTVLRGISHRYSLFSSPKQAQTRLKPALNQV